MSSGIITDGDRLRDAMFDRDERDKEHEDRMIRIKGVTWMSGVTPPIGSKCLFENCPCEAERLSQRNAGFTCSKCHHFCGSHQVFSSYWCPKCGERTYL